MNKLFKLIFVAIFATTSLFAIQKENIEKDMEKRIATIIDILKQKELTLENKEEKIIKAIDGVFDFRLMSRITLGKNWKKIDETQKAEFIEAYKKKLEKKYFANLKDYNGQEIKVVGTDSVISKKSGKAIKNRLLLKTELVGDKKFEINYLFYKNKKTNEWSVYDVTAENISILKADKAEFSSFLSSKPIDELIANIKENNKK